MTNDIRFKEFRIDSFDAEKGIVEGYASKFGNVDQVGDVVEKGAFTKSIQQGANRVRFLWQHNKQEPIGVIQEIREDDHGLYIEDLSEERVWVLVAEKALAKDGGK